MKTRKQKKNTKALKAAKKLEAQKPLLTVPLTDVQTTKVPTSSGGGTIPQP